MAGELKYDRATDTWTMDNNSGRYGFDKYKDGGFPSRHTAENLDATVDLANQTGTTAKIKPQFFEQQP